MLGVPTQIWVFDRTASFDRVIYTRPSPFTAVIFFLPKLPSPSPLLAPLPPSPPPSTARALIFFLVSVVGISFMVVLVLVDSFVDYVFRLSLSSFLDSRYYHGSLTLMQCTLRFASILSPSLLLYPPCMNVCRNFKPHEWDGHHGRRRSRRPSEVLTVGTPDARLELLAIGSPNYD